MICPTNAVQSWKYNIYEINSTGLAYNTRFSDPNDHWLHPSTTPTLIYENELVNQPNQVKKNCCIKQTNKFVDAQLFPLNVYSLISVPHIAPYQNSTSNNTMNTLSWPHKCLHMHVNRSTHFCSKFLRLDINSFDVRSKIRSGGTGGCRHRSDRDKLETQVIPDLVPVQLTIILSNSKSDQNMMCSGLKCTLPITTKLCTHHDSIKILLRFVEHILKYSTPNYDGISN